MINSKFKIEQRVYFQNVQEGKIMRKSILCLIFLVVMLWPLQPAVAKDVNDEIAELKARIEQLEKKVAQREDDVQAFTEDRKALGKIKEAYERLTPGASLTSTFQASANRNGKDPADGGFSGYVELDAHVGKLGRFYVNFEGGQGEGVGRKLNSSERLGIDSLPVLTGINEDALESDSKYDIIEAYWEPSLFDERLVFNIGKLDHTIWVDGNAVMNDETTQFLSNIFVNQIAMGFQEGIRVYAPGVRVGIMPKDWLEMNIEWFKAAGDVFEDLFDHPFGIWEFNFKPKFGKLEGNYRFYGWYDGQEHAKWSQYDPATGAVSGNAKSSNAGLGLSWDQMISRSITVAARFGVQNNGIAGRAVAGALDTAFFPYSWSVGGQITGALWGRSNDTLGLAYGQAVTGNDFRNYLRDQGVINPAPYEGHFEAYYSFALNDHIAISPDIQVMSNLGGDDDADTVTIFGLRSQLEF